MAEKEVRWVGSSLADLNKMPRRVKTTFGHALHVAQLGGRQELNTKVMTGFKGAGVIEIIEDEVGGTYRCIYTVKFKEAIYVLHAYQKKSKKGSETPKEEVEIIKERLKIVQNLSR
jgi:phage-related protein